MNPEFIPISPNELKKLYTPKCVPIIDPLLPTIAKFANKPPYSGESLQLFTNTVGENPQTGYWFLRLVRNYWKMNEQPIPQEATTSDEFVAELKTFCNTFGNCDSINLLIWCIEDALFSLDHYQEYNTESDPQYYQECFQAVPDIVRKVVQPLQKDSIVGLFELKSILRNHGLDPNPI